ncbi:MAG: hypothetical protein V4525_15170 [Pseudomonadota bacterium]
MTDDNTNPKNSTDRIVADIVIAALQAKSLHGNNSAASTENICKAFLEIKKTVLNSN